MNIVYLNHYAGSPAHGMEYRPYYLAREWVRLGHRVQMLAADFSHVRATQPAAGDAPGSLRARPAHPAPSSRSSEGSRRRPEWRTGLTHPPI